MRITDVDFVYMLTGKTYFCILDFLFRMVITLRCHQYARCDLVNIGSCHVSLLSSVTLKYFTDGCYILIVDLHERVAS